MSSISEEEFLDWRGITPVYSMDDPATPIYDLCKGCNGSGTKLYGSTSTWHGGIGGSAMTTDVCDKCWGSGQEHRPWPSHREFYQMRRYIEQLKKEKKDD